MDDVNGWVVWIEDRVNEVLRLLERCAEALERIAEASERQAEEELSE
jgi:hypothetical protein